MLVLHGTGDKFAHIDGSQEIYGSSLSPDKKFIPYNGLDHQLFEGPNATKVIEDIKQWILQMSAIYNPNVEIDEEDEDF